MVGRTTPERHAIPFVSETWFHRWILKPQKVRIDDELFEVRGNEFLSLLRIPFDTVCCIQRLYLRLQRFLACYLPLSVVSCKPKVI